MDTSIGAFVLPNAQILDETPLGIFKVPGEHDILSVSMRRKGKAECVLFVPTVVDAVEKAAGLSLFDNVTKATSKELCKTVKCEVIVRRFDDAAKKGGRRANKGANRECFI